MAHLESESDNLNEKTRFLENQVQKLYGLIEASGAVISTLELEVVLDRVMEIAKKVIGAEASSLLLVNESSGNLAYTVALGEKGEDIKGKLELEKGKGIAGWVAQTGIPQLVTDVTKDSRFYGEVDKITGFKTRSIMCVPMKVHGKLIGVLEAINPVSSECFTPADLEILSAYAGLASIAIDNALMARQMIEKKAIEKELAIAREIQQKFLIHKFPECDTYKVYAKTQSSREIGGDFYDINWDDKGHIGVMIGDVCGRGIPAALYMIEVLSAWRTQQASQKTLCSCICKLNEDLIQKSTFGSFVTLLCSHLDTKTGSLRFINAGHVPLLIVNLEKKEARFVSDKNIIPLGIQSCIAGLDQSLVQDCDNEIPVMLRDKTCVELIERRVTLNLGDYLFFMTDGLTESMNSAGEEFGIERISNIILSHGSIDTPKDIVDHIFKELELFCSGSMHQDDITFVALKYCGESSG